MDRITTDTPGDERDGDERDRGKRGRDARDWDERDWDERDWHARDWDERVTAAWARLDAYPPTEEGAERFRALIGALADELQDDHPYGLFERACAWDSTGRSDLAVPLYRRALDGGLDGHKGRRARIQLASSLRNVGRAEEGIALLEPELTGESDELDDAVRCVLALCLSSLGRDREGLSLVLEAMAARLPRYQRSMAVYARALRDR